MQPQRHLIFFLIARRFYEKLKLDKDIKVQDIDKISIRKLVKQIKEKT